MPSDVEILTGTDAHSAVFSTRVFYSSVETVVVLGVINLFLDDMSLNGIAACIALVLAVIPLVETIQPRGLVLSTSLFCGTTVLLAVYSDISSKGPPPVEDFVLQPYLNRIGTMTTLEYYVVVTFDEDEEAWNSNHVIKVRYLDDEHVNINRDARKQEYLRYLLRCYEWWHATEGDGCTLNLMIPERRMVSGKGFKIKRLDLDVNLFETPIFGDIIAPDSIMHFVLSKGIKDDEDVVYDSKKWKQRTVDLTHNTIDVRKPTWWEWIHECISLLWSFMASIVKEVGAIITKAFSDWLAGGLVTIFATFRICRKLNAVLDAIREKNPKKPPT